MSLNSQNKISIFRLIYFLAILFLFLALINYLPKIDGSNMSADAALAYTYCIESENVLDWHSPLFMYECIYLKKLFSLFGVYINGWLCIRYMAVIHFVLMALGVAYLTALGCRKTRCCVLFPVLLFVVVYVNGLCQEWRLDNFFLCSLFPLVASIVAFYRVKRRWWKLCLLILSFAILWHSCSLRKNALLLVPVYVFSICYVHSKWRQLGILVKSFSVVCISSIYFVIFMVLSNLMLPSLKSYPVTPMLISDVRIAYILRGKSEDLFEKEKHIGKLPIKNYSLGAHWHVVHDKDNCEICHEIPNVLLMHASNPYGLYWETLKLHTQEILLAKLIQINQFYCAGWTPSFLRELIESQYSVIRRDVRITWPGVFRPYRIADIWGTHILLAITMLYSMKKLKEKGIAGSCFNYFYVLIGLCAILYTLSFTVVTPTPDDRYLMPSLSLAHAILIVWLGKWINERYGKYVSFSLDRGARRLLERDEVK